MIEYYLPKSSINIELAILSGGITVTGRTPTVLVRKRDTGNYFDFTSRTFTSVTTSATAVLTSSLDGLYTFSWNIQNIFNSDTYLTFEYHDATSLAVDDVSLITKAGGGGGIGSVEIKGVWTAKQKKELMDNVKDIKKDLQEFRERTYLLLRKILSKETLQKEDLNTIKSIKETDNAMWQEFLKIMKLQENATTKDLLNALEEYYKAEHKASREVRERLNKMKENLKHKSNISEEEDDE